jgi:hypothetical protein
MTMEVLNCLRRKHFGSLVFMATVRTAEVGWRFIVVDRERGSEFAADPLNLWRYSPRKVGRVNVGFEISSARGASAPKKLAGVRAQ